MCPEGCGRWSSALPDPQPVVDSGQEAVGAARAQALESVIQVWPSVKRTVCVEMQT